MWAGGDNLELARFEISDTLGAVRRRAAPILIWTALLTGGLLYRAHSAPNEYRAATELVLEQPDRAGDSGDEDRQVHQLFLDDATFQTQLHVIASELLLRQVYDDLDLARAPGMSSNSQGGTAGSQREPPQTDGRSANTKIDDRFTRFVNRVRARRIGLSYTVEISYWAQDPLFAARVVNAVADAYVTWRVKLAAAERTHGALSLKQHAARVRAEVLTAYGASRAGVLPAAYFPDADVRLLGGATASVSPAFPNRQIVGGAAIALGLLSGLLAVIALNRFDRRVRTPLRLRAWLGLDVTAHAPSGRADRARWSIALGTLSAAAMRANAVGQGARIGVLGFHEDGEADRLARDLDRMTGDARWPGMRETPEVDAIKPQWTPLTMRVGPIEVGESSVLDAMVLVVDAHRTRLGEVKAALDALAAARIRLVGTLLTH